MESAAEPPKIPDSVRYATYGKETVDAGQEILDKYLVEGDGILEVALDFLDFLAGKKISYTMPLHSSVMLVHNKILD